MEQIIQRLIADFAYVHTESVDETSGKIHYQSTWAGKTADVKAIIVYLSGTDSLTGAPVEDADIGFQYTMTSTNGFSKPALYWGDFQLRYDAVLDDGRRVRDFIPPRTIELRVPSRRPVLQYQVKEAKYGFSKVTITGNCLPRYTGHLWVSYAGGYSRIPGTQGIVGTMEFYFPKQSGIQIIADDGFPLTEIK